MLIHGGASYYSDDEGATLNTLSDAVTDEATLTYGYTAGCVFRGDIVLFVEDTTTTDRIHHLVSTDGGSTFNLVQTTDQLGQRVQCVANDDGIHLVWVNQGPGASPSTVEYRRLGSAFEPLDAVASTILTTGPEWDEACIWADYAGALQVLYTGAGASWPASMPAIHGAQAIAPVAGTQAIRTTTTNTCAPPMPWGRRSC